MGFTVRTPTSAVMLVQMGESAINIDDGDESDYYQFSRTAAGTP
jgi:hypothetical protein